MKINFFAEFFGTAFLLAMVTGSGIMGESLAQGNEAIALLMNSLATGAGLYVLIQCLGSISGAHFNPAVTFVEALTGKMCPRKLLVYFSAQFTGAILGVFITHFMFNQPIIQHSTKLRFGPHLWLSEVVATFGLICTIKLASRKSEAVVPMAVALYITSAYWFTSSTSFANPAVTVARMFTNTFVGISANDCLPFIGAQIVGALLAFIVIKSLDKNLKLS